MKKFFIILIATCLLASVMSPMAQAQLYEDVNVQLPMGWYYRNTSVNLVCSAWSKYANTNYYCRAYFSGVPLGWSGYADVWARFKDPATGKWSPYYPRRVYYNPLGPYTIKIP